MPEIKIKHVVSFSSEDKVHKAENLMKPETYRKWKCATPGEKSATVVLQFEKATQIHSIDIGNECSAFIEVLVGRSSDTVSDYQVLLVASSFMSPLESRTSAHAQRVRMFGPEKLSQSTKDEKWDCVQVVCTQPFNKNITYGLSFIKFHSPPEKVEEYPKRTETAPSKIGSFELKPEYEDDDSLLAPGSWYKKQKEQVSESSPNSTISKAHTSYASSVLSTQNNPQKRKADEKSSSDEPPVKKTTTVLNKDHIVYKDVLRDVPEKQKVSSPKPLENNNPSSPKPRLFGVKPSENKKPTTPTRTNVPGTSNKVPATNNNLKGNSPIVKTPTRKANADTNQKVPFEKLMDNVVFVLSGFVNPLRSELRDKALEMGAKYKADWDRSCTHLVCAFLNTPKYQQVNQLKGRIVTKEWILDCYKTKKPLPWSRYMLGKSSKDSSSSSEDDDDSEDISDEGSNFSEELDSEEEWDWKRATDEIKKKRKEKQDKKKQNNGKNVATKPVGTKRAQSDVASNKTSLSTLIESVQQNISNKASAVKKDPDAPAERNNTGAPARGNISDDSRSPTRLAIKDESETDDEEAIKDYIADTDVDNDSGGDTEDEIRRVEMEIQKNGGSPKSKKVSKENDVYLEKPDVKDMPLPELPNLFKQKHFFLFGDFSPTKQHDMHRYIIAYNGVLEDYMSDKIKYVVTDAKWDKNFEDALNENEDLIFVKPAWIYKCHDARKLVPYQPYIVIPDSET